MSTCLAVIPECDECLKVPPRCDGTNCDDLCRVTGANLRTNDEWHKALHRARYCRSCGHFRYNPDGRPNHVVRPCKYGNCANWHCPNCDHWIGGDGPAMCRCNTSWLLTRLVVDVRRRLNFLDRITTRKGVR